MFMYYSDAMRDFKIKITYIIIVLDLQLSLDTHNFVT